MNLNRLHPQEGVFHPLESITDFLELRLTLDIRPSFATTAPGSLCVEKEQCTRTECRVPHHVSFQATPTFEKFVFLRIHLQLKHA